MLFGVALGRMHPSMFSEATVIADDLGFESVWMPEHLVLPVQMTGSPFAGADHPPIPPSTPVYDVFAYLAFLSAKTTRVRLGTHVYNLALRHPFAAARAIATLDVLSEGRALVGVGASWLDAEWQAVGLDFSTRGKRLDEALSICKRLWTDEVIEHKGQFFSFDPVMFEPKPTTKPHPPIYIGGETPAALRRAAKHEGWIGLEHTAESIVDAVAELRKLREQSGFGDAPFAVTVGASITDEAQVSAFENAGVDRLIVAPWQRTREVPDALATFARRFIGESRSPWAW